MKPVRLGAVSYLNAKPLVSGLDERPDLFALRFDLPSQCAVHLHDGHVDLALVPAIEYQRGDYEIVPGVAIGSNGPIASVALYSRVPVAKIEALALDTSSRTSVALTRILCAERWGIAPRFIPAAPDLTAMLMRADAALVIGDPALEIDAASYGAHKVDLGTEWQSMTGLPFVYAFWAGRAGAVTAAHVEALVNARDRGVRSIAAIAAAECRGQAGRQARILAYLRDNLKYGLGGAELAGLGRFYDLAAGLGVIPAVRPLRFY